MYRQTSLQQGSCESSHVEFTQAGKQFGVEDGGAGGAANGVMRERDELPVEQTAGAQAADGHRHPMIAIAVEARLGAVILRRKLYRLIGSGGQLPAGQRAKLRPCSQY